MHLHLGHLYPQTMSTYGDSGNIRCLVQRCRWRGIEVTVHPLEVGQPLPPHLDFYFFGGGQDVAQGSLSHDLASRASRLRDDVEAGVPLLAICGGYQLLGASYLPFEGEPIPGIGLFPVQTSASRQRMIGNLVVRLSEGIGLPSQPPTLVGFENHSGKTRITNIELAKPLGTVLSGYGNNGEDGQEGCLIHSAVGCYLHGPLLPKNPHLADWFIERCCQRHEPEYSLTPLDDSLELATHHQLVERYS